MEVTAKQRAQQAKKVTFLAIWVDGAIGLVKVITGLLVNSAALIADGIHSLSDLLTNFFVLAANHYGNQGPDSDHPYGHGRIETLATLFMGGVLILVALGIVFASAQRFFSGTSIPEPGIWAITIALISLLLKEVLFHITMRVARRIHSKLLEANAWHSRSDSLSTLVVLIALIGAEFGYGWLDTVAAVIVGLMVGKIGLNLILDSSKELVDTALPEKTQKAMCQLARAVPGVLGVHDLRTRQSAGRTMVDFHLVVSPRISISEGHEIGNEVSRRLRKQFSKITDLTFHIDPEDDEGRGDPSLQPGLPLRPKIEALLKERWQALSLWNDIQDIDLHYLNGGVILVIHLDENTGFNSDETLRLLKSQINDINWIKNIELIHHAK
ncbi:cation transporter [Thiomicrospira microaerophila]|uniref:cation diffusion facilitator family transporter n=1 Tax=Thiomicrospira microaerophila TaxID=406020 RepID=UPI00200C7F20|nr:cation diffusion facilitator family transporter [Thiomicrospira microaerophila]UQB42318.1 cation transporter [Thiomicrospira microaerophila]